MVLSGSVEDVSNDVQDGLFAVEDGVDDVDVDDGAEDRLWASNTCCS
jgi:hypothetical protein